MKSKLLRIGIVSMTVGLMACASSAFAQAAGEERDKTILVQYALPNESPGPTSAVNAASVGTAANQQMSYGPVARSANDRSPISAQQIADDTPARWLESKARGHDES